MANHYRILNVVFSKDRQAVESFLDGLKSGGWGAHVELPVPHDGECGLLQSDGDRETPICGRCERQAWGSLLFPDIRILTSEGVSEIEDCRDLPDFKYHDPFTEASAVILGASYAGFTRPEPADHIAVLLAESRGGVPHVWLKKVIEDNYESGLRFFARCFDLGDVPYNDGEDGRSFVFYSSDDAEHYAALTEEPVAMKSGK